MPLPARSAAVPPVDSSSMLRGARARASSSRPVLSETDSSARRTGSGMARAAAPSGAPKSELLQLLAQRAAVDAENAGGAALVAFRVVEDDPEQGLLDLAQHQVIEVCGSVPVETGEVVDPGALRVVPQLMAAAT